MDPRKLPFNALIVGPTNSGKTQYLIKIISCKPTAWSLQEEV